MKKNEHNTKWIEDLRSGNYEQCRGRLKHEGFANQPATYCCLGVAVESLGGDWSGSYGETPLSHHSADSGLNIEARELLDLDPTDEGVCITLNDAVNRNFAEIADVIERAIEDDVPFNTAARSLRFIS